MTNTTTFGNHQYQLIASAKTWSEANQYSTQQGGHLAYIESLAENNAIRDFLLPLSTSFPTVSDGGGARYVWLGANDIASEGTWKWANNTSINGYTNWGSGSLGAEPDNYQGAQDGVAMGLTVWPYPSGGLGQAGQWNDINENNKIYFVIEWDGLSGTSGNDTFDGGTGVTIDGKEGIDTVRYTSKFVTPTKTSAGWQLGSDTLTNVERLHFSDKKVALDVTDNALETLQFIGVIAPSLKGNLEIRKVILSLFDQGKSMQEMCQLALDLGLITSDNNALAKSVYKNVFETPAEPDQGLANLLVNFIEKNGDANFLATVAGLNINVDLVGLQQHGMEFL